MTEIERIVDQLQRAFDGDAWHGPSLVQLLSGVDASQATARPISLAHSIFELVLHIAAWEGAGKRRLEGDPAQLKASEDWPPVNDTTEAAWEQAKQQLMTTHNELLDAVKTIDASRLDQPIIKDPAVSYSTVYVTLQGVVQHGLYHAGQIAILKRALA
ncbi:MAG: DinB family protein [Pyrinomonadaceae bacterium]